MQGWNNIPFFRLLAPFVAGIITGNFFEFNFYFFVTLLAVMLFVSLFQMPGLYSYRYGYIHGMIVNIALFICGFSILTIGSLSQKTSAITYWDGRKTQLIFTIKDPPVETKKTYRITVERVCFFENNDWRELEKDLIVYVDKENGKPAIEYGDVFLAEGYINKVVSLGNPYEFDYAKYLNSHGIGFVMNSNSGKWIKLGNNPSSYIKKYSIITRNYMLNRMMKFNMTNHEYQVAAALLLGSTDELDKDVEQIYIYTGTVHVLSVSGLHVGLIYLLLSFVFSFSNKWKFGKYFGVIFIVLFLWAYAFITGLSPSVLRATVMFNFVVIGGLIKRNINVYNSIFASAFFLLLINPVILFDVGFQLSYLAVIGIVMFYKGIYSLLTLENYITDKIWSVVAVSISAQIFTFPLSLYYFHQFPLYFILSNIFAIPLVTAIMYVGVTSLLLIFVPVVSGVLFFFLSKLIFVLNTGLVFFESMPSSVISNISFEFIDTVFIYVFILMATAFFFYKRYAYLTFSMLTIIGFLCYRIALLDRCEKQNRVVVYNFKGVTAIEFMSANTSYVYLNKFSPKNELSLNYYAANNRLNRGIEKSYFINNHEYNYPIFRNGRFMKFQNKKIFVADNNAVKTNIMLENKINIDIVVLTGDYTADINKLFDCFNIGMLVADSSVPHYRINKAKSACDRNSCVFYSVNLSGALVIDV